MSTPSEEDLTLSVETIAAPPRYRHLSRLLIARKPGAKVSMEALRGLLVGDFAVCVLRLDRNQAEVFHGPTGMVTIYRGTFAHDAARELFNKVEEDCASALKEAKL